MHRVLPSAGLDTTISAWHGSSLLSSATKDDSHLCCQTTQGHQCCYITYSQFKHNTTVHVQVRLFICLRATTISRLSSSAPEAPAVCLQKKESKQ